MKGRKETRKKRKRKKGRKESSQHEPPCICLSILNQRIPKK